MKKPPKRRYVPPVNVKAVTVYLTPEQLEGAKRLADQETTRREEEFQRDPSAMLPKRVTVSDLIRSLLQRELSRSDKERVVQIESDPQRQS
jgi:hypothetical protein